MCFGAKINQTMRVFLIDEVVLKIRDELEGWLPVVESEVTTEPDKTFSVKCLKNFPVDGDLSCIHCRRLHDRMRKQAAQDEERVVNKAVLQTPLCITTPRIKDAALEEALNLVDEYKHLLGSMNCYLVKKMDGSSFCTNILWCS